MQRTELGTRIYEVFLSVLIALLIVIGVYAGLGKENVNVDQLLWYDRSEKFVEAFLGGDFKSTYQQYHPGVTLMYLISAGQFTYKLVTGDTSTPSHIKWQNYPTYNFYTKVYLASFVLVALFFCAYLLYRITNKKIIFFVFLILLLSEPYFLGLTRNLHMDALISVLALLSFLLTFYGVNSSQRKLIILSGFISGLGLLTKSVFIQFIVTNIAVISIYFLTDLRSRKKHAISLAYYLGVLALTFVILFPSMWVAPGETLNSVFVKGLFGVGVSGGDNFHHYINNRELTDPGVGFYLLVSKYRFSVLFQILFVLCCIYGFYSLYNVYIKKNSIEPARQNSPAIMTFFLIIFSVVYFLSISLVSKKTDRYISVLFPYLAAIFSVVVVSFYTKVGSYLYKKIAKIFLVLLVLINVVLGILIYPYYFAFYSPIWGGVKKAKEEIYINQGGIGAYEVAQFLNGKGYGKNELAGAINSAELNVFLRNSLSRTDRSGRKEYKYFVLTVQKYDDFRRGKKVLKTIDIYGYPYIEIVGK